MRAFLRHLFFVFAHLGGFGLLLLGVLDSSFLFLPLGNDLLMIVLTARHKILMPFYAVMAAAGSVIGCLITDLVSREAGEEGLEKRVPRKRFEYVKAKITKSGAWALALAALMPPPFPFTAFVAAASALQYPRKKLLSVIAVSRFARFSIEGVLAIFFGRGILRLARADAVYYGMMVLVIISIAGSAFSIYNLAKKSKTAEQQPARPGKAA